jgi:hypothetical protein
MPTSVARRSSFAFLCAAPVVAIVAGASRGMRIPGVYQAVGVLLFGTVATAAWLLGLRAIKGGADTGRRCALAGGLLLLPFALVALLWVGLSTPWEATPPENEMRYLVLIISGVAVASGFVVLQQLLGDAGERFYSTLGFATNAVAGVAYLVWTSFALGDSVVMARDGHRPPDAVLLSAGSDVLLFVACALTYITTAAFAAALGRIQWLGRGATRTFVTTNLVAMLLIGMRGLTFPDPNAGAAPWYLNAGFVVGIPAVPWIVPFLLGVVLLRRAGDE